MSIIVSDPQIAIQLAFSVQMTGRVDPMLAGQQNASPSDARHWAALEAGKILKAVDALPRIEKNWCYFAFWPREWPQHADRLRRRITAEYFRAANKANFKNFVTRMECLLVLCDVAHYDARHRVRTGSSPYTPGALIEYIRDRAQIDVDPSHWARDWEPQYREIMQPCFKINANAMTAIKNVVDSHLESARD